jgi:hypothetical protein
VTPYFTIRRLNRSLNLPNPYRVQYTINVANTSEACERGRHVNAGCKNILVVFQARKTIEVSL